MADQLFTKLRRHIYNFIHSTRIYNRRPKIGDPNDTGFKTLNPVPQRPWGCDV